MVKVAIVQAAPVFMNREASLARAIEYIGEAAKEGAQLVVFGETWLPGYPAWLDYCPGAALWDHEPAKEVFGELRRNSLSIPSREAQMLAKAAGDHKVVLVIGANESVDEGPGNRKLNNPLLTYGSVDVLLNHHRILIHT